MIDILVIRLSLVNAALCCGAFGLVPLQQSNVKFIRSINSAVSKTRSDMSPSRTYARMAAALVWLSVCAAILTFMFAPGGSSRCVVVSFGASRSWPRFSRCHSRSTSSHLANFLGANKMSFFIRALRVFLRQCGGSGTTNTGPPVVGCSIKGLSGDTPILCSAAHWVFSWSQVRTFTATPTFSAASKHSVIIWRNN